MGHPRKHSYDISFIILVLLKNGALTTFGFLKHRYLEICKKVKLIFCDRIKKKGFRMEEGVNVKKYENLK